MNIKTPVRITETGRIRDAEGHTLVDASVWPETEREELARAINAHDALVAALDDIKWTSCERDNMEYSSKITCYQYEAIFNALKLAKGE